MNCTGCNRPLSDDHAFCPGCGARRPGTMPDDERIALDIVNAGASVCGDKPLENLDDEEIRKVAMAILAKARELLCAPLESEIARLKEELSAARKGAAKRAVFVGIDRGSPNGDQAAFVEMEQRQDGSMCVIKVLHGAEAESEIARREQCPAVDVDGLAKVLKDYATQRGMMFTWKGQAQADLDYLAKHGGSR